MQCSKERKSLLRTKVVTTKRRLQPKTEIVTQNCNRRERQRGCDVRLRSRHQFLRTTEPKRLRPQLRSRPLINEAARNLVATEETWSQLNWNKKKKEIQVATST